MQLSSRHARALDPRIHLLAKKDGLHRTSGLPEVRTFKWPQIR